MRRIVMFNRVTADGYFAAADGGLDWVVPDEELDKHAADNLAGQGTLLFGRKTYDMFAHFWPNAVGNSDTAADPHGSGRSREMRAMAVWLNEARKFVYSRTLSIVAWKHSQLRSELDFREIASMKQEPGADIMIFGSGSIVRQLTEQGLIDEYQLVVNPIFIGDGRPLLSGISDVPEIELADCHAFPSGNVMLRYARR